MIDMTFDSSMGICPLQELIFRSWEIRYVPDIRGIIGIIFAMLFLITKIRKRFA